MSAPTPSPGAPGVETSAEQAARLAELARRVETYAEEATAAEAERAAARELAPFRVERFILLWAVALLQA